MGNQNNCCGDVGHHLDEVVIGNRPKVQTNDGDEVFERADENGIWARIDKLQKWSRDSIMQF